MEIINKRNENKNKSWYNLIEKKKQLIWLLKGCL